ncbi:TetR family transcriptional regulator [Solihabitans fulvus]|uniref:TetR family transcriptional regulator n=1 Tax=Solihabitans fulvus TaxID=1892852 RepID=A0A5B2WRG1_9PSEU|nr:TetR/AcrR family transcriptional regulator [Solihabitans fulvus]KAA2253568.1 TetR family transcriptional regulator [Solihabitans fulvus]
MVSRAGLSQEAVVDAALELVDQDGLDALTLAAVANRTGVATPSLYKHVRNLAALRQLIALRVLDELTERLGAAAMGRSEEDAIRALMLAYRQYAAERPHRYAALPQKPQPDAALAAAGGRLVEVFLAVLRGYGLTDSAAIHATRCVRAAVHGFVALEVAGGFGLPEKLDVTYENLIDMVSGGLRTGTFT